MTSVSPGDAAGAAGYAAGQGQGFTSQSAEFFLSNYRLGKTLGIGSFGKVRGDTRQWQRQGLPACRQWPPPASQRLPACSPLPLFPRALVVLRMRGAAQVG